MNSVKSFLGRDKCDICMALPILFVPERVAAGLSCMFHPSMWMCSAVERGKVKEGGNCVDRSFLAK